MYTILTHIGAGNMYVYSFWPTGNGYQQHTYIHTCMHACMHTYIHTSIDVLLPVCMYVLGTQLTKLATLRVTMLLCYYVTYIHLRGATMSHSLYIHLVKAMISSGVS